MGEIVFAHVAMEILHHMCDGGWGAAVIEGSAVEGKDEDERAAGAKDSLPFHERLDRISEVLKVMRGEDEVVGGISYRSEPGPVTDDVFSSGFTGRKDEVVRVGCPGVGGGEVAVVDRADLIVKGKGAAGTKDGAGAADFKANFAADDSYIGRVAGNSVPVGAEALVDAP
jgi:hypothetical protein